jgi:hypothetical protein
MASYDSQHIQAKNMTKIYKNLEKFLVLKQEKNIC